MQTQREELVCQTSKRETHWQCKRNKFSTRFDPWPFKVIRKKGTMATATRNWSYIPRNVSLIKKIDMTLQGTDQDKSENNPSVDGSDTLPITLSIPIVQTVSPAPVLVPPVCDDLIEQVTLPRYMEILFIMTDWLPSKEGDVMDWTIVSYVSICVYVSIIWTIIINQQLLLNSYWYDVMWWITTCVFTLMVTNSS